MDVTLQWDTNTEPDRAGYRIYYNTESGPPYEGMGAARGDSPIDVKLADVEAGNTASYTVTDLNDDETYFFAVSATTLAAMKAGIQMKSQPVAISVPGIAIVGEWAASSPP